MQTKNSVTLLLHGGNSTLIWGMTNAERNRRLVEKLPDGANGTLWVNLAYVFDPQWMRHVQDNPGTVLTIGGVPVLASLHAKEDTEALAELRIPAGAHAMEYQDKPRIYNRSLRKLETPFVRELTPTTVKDIERQSYFGAYKGVTDILTKYLWPELALVLTRFAARIGMTPNMVTSIGAIGCISAIFLFYYGYFWTGMAAGFVFMVLDTVDGKLARCTITSSFWGNIFDHGLDLVHPPFWWVAWAFGLGTAGLALPEDQLRLVMIVILGGYVLQRIIEGIFMRAFGQHIHVWRPMDSWFRLITARRNPNMVLLFVSMIFGRPDIGLIAVAWWTLISLAVHMVQILQAVLVRIRGGQIVSWLEQEQG
ncbi:CDP-alcohol phosphatidyltransferase family protein [Parasphingorhabdus sp.]|uniref:CDP-alcohol phosphatidyltransferase family protein n=1 Tax=Parasphingorhabdus sp. TaxID=2709688 RepID=UPI003FA78B73